MEIWYPVLVFCLLLVSAAIGWAAQRRLRERHVTPASVESIRLLMGMLLTFSALVLGLLTSNAKQRFDSYNNELSAYGVDLVELDHRLRVYGQDARGIRSLLRSYTAAAIADTWPREKPPTGDYPKFVHSSTERSVEVAELGDMLAQVDVEIERLAPSDEFHRDVAARLRARVTQVVGQRWELIFSARSVNSWPFLLMLTWWLLIIFAIFGLTSPRGRLVYAVVGLSAMSVASPLYLIISYSGAQSGSLKLSSFPLRVALSHMDRDS